MREILFRGRRVDNGEWIKGGYYKDYCYGNKLGEKTYITEWNTFGLGFIDNIQVDHNTIGQFTGLTDKNGKKIFEGDILRFPAKDEYEKTTFFGYEVFYHDNDCADNHIGFQMNRMHPYGHLCGGECRAKLLPKYTSQMVIVGNIHDNPELLS